MIASGELDFFNNIKDECKIIFDVGCRTDSHYYDIHPIAEYHLFEPNDQFYNEIVHKIKAQNVRINNFGLGKKTEVQTYYQDSQSFFKRSIHFQSNPMTAKVCHIKKYSEYLSENNIHKIDFLKIDTEGCEPDILFDNVEFNQTIKFIQFEYASTWLDRSDKFILNDIRSAFHTFDFYYLYDEKHPICLDNKDTLTRITDSNIGQIESYMTNAYGFNIVMIKR